MKGLQFKIPLSSFGWFGIRLASFLAFVLLANLPEAAAEPAYTTFDTPRFTLYFGDTAPSSPPDQLFAKNIADRAIAILDDTADEYRQAFGVDSSKRVVLRFLSPDEFRRQTGAPAWTSAMFYRGEISIPFTRTKGINFAELKRALRHEYVHAVFADLSDYRCPAWLDEGVAQILEGSPNPLLGPALRKWVKGNPTMPLDWLQNGFTTLDSEIVPAAYAQSLFATRILIEEHGFEAVVSYLRQLRLGLSPELSFERAFGKSQVEFEKSVQVAALAWASSEKKHP